ncbi:hypothetical protein Cgig2_010042 [Carnegiea gigantea]|uniref:DNA-directed DNA polymerase n=1 Tax=Carnegiea gigantea TaxID=171969 RepID=A0A9Q1GT10_9CARY|nr:hypothetical protein Cgig2_013847 [Carnegiea gigantea]KAJ8435495.1 hypothetical protein Cgig2_010042 [Carnegiea gigantea]
MTPIYLTNRNEDSFIRRGYYGGHTEVCEFDRYRYLLKKDETATADQISENYFIVSYKTDTYDMEWRPPRNSAVQISAAITAWARIHMYPLISRGDCYYTDTDSVVLKNPLPEDQVSSSELGKMKLEHEVIKGIFLAPKSYCISTREGGDVVKHKGPGRALVDPQWFEDQFQNINRTIQGTVESNFMIDWKRLDIKKGEKRVNLTIKMGIKREKVYDEKGIWIGTKPLHIIDLAGQEERMALYFAGREREAREEALYFAGRENIDLILVELCRDVASRTEPTYSQKAVGIWTASIVGRHKAETGVVCVIVVNYGDVMMTLAAKAYGRHD